MSGKPYYSDKQLEDLQAKLQSVEGRTNDLLLKYMAHSFASKKAEEFAHRGFGRRIQTLRRCLQKLFGVLPAETVIVPDRDRLYDAQINLQAFVANVFGVTDNLAWIWEYERGLAEKIKPLQVGLRKKNSGVRTSLPQIF